MKPTVKTTIKNILKFAFVLGLLVFLAKKGFLSLEDTAKAFHQWRYIVPAYLCLSIAFVLGFLRWHWLLRAQQIHLKVLRTAELGVIGNFFNIALPGAVSGDVVKAMYVSKESKGRASNALASILFDRISGVSGLILIAASSLVFGMHAPWSGKVIQSLEFFVICLGAGVVTFYSYLFLVRAHHDPLLYVLTRMTKRHPRLGSIQRSYEGIRLYGRAKGTVLSTLLISICIHLLVIFACVLFTQALNQATLPLGALLVLVPLGLLTTAVPISPAGVGTGNLAFGYLFDLLGSKAGANVFNLFLISQLFYGALGGLAYLRFKHSADETLGLARTSQ